MITVIISICGAEDGDIIEGYYTIYSGTFHRKAAVICATHHLLLARLVWRKCLAHLDSASL